MIGPIPTLWDSNGPRAAFSLADDLLAECRPDFVQIHSGEPATTTAMLRRLLPRVQVIMGLGVDETARNVASGRRSVDWGIKHLTEFAQTATNIGASTLIFNAEASWKTPPNTMQRKRLSDLVRGALDAIHTEFPLLVLGHTAYDHPTFHSTYNWSDWIGKQSPVAFSLPQVYAAGEGLVMAARGALPARETRALASWATAVRNNWIDADIPDGQPGDDTDVDWRPYLQLHGVTAVDTITCAIQHPFAALWALSSRSDTAGRNAFRALCALNRAGHWAPGLAVYNGRKVSVEVQRHQTQLGVVADGNYGAKTAKADGIRWE